MTVAGAVAQADIRAAPVARDTLQERVYNRLASLILDGDIPPGRLVTIQSLAEAFGVSAMPVREALKRLTASNALTVVSGRSIGVPPITLERFTDLRNVRREIEGAATAWAAKRIDADEPHVARARPCPHGSGDRVGRDDGLSQGQSLVSLYDLPSLGFAGVGGADREPLAADQPLLQSAARFGQLRLGQLQPSDLRPRRSSAATPLRRKRRSEPISIARSMSWPRCWTETQARRSFSFRRHVAIEPAGIDFG